MRYKVFTKWIGYSEIEVEAKSEEEAIDKVNSGEYEPENELSTGTGLNLGYDEEEVLEIEEVSNG
jgi:hypothetical protein